MTHNLTLVGAGPIGIEMAIALKRTGIKYVHYEAGCLASTVNWYAPGTVYFSSPERLSLSGVPFETSPHLKATREDYLLYLRNLVKQFNLKINYFKRITQIEKCEDGNFNITICSSTTGVGGKEDNEVPKTKFKLKTQQIKSRKIILAIGDMHKPRMINIPGEVSPFVSHFLPDPHTLSGMKVTIVGGRNSAIEAAIRLYRANAKVTIVHRRDTLDADRIKPWLLPELNALVRENKISLILSTEVKEIKDEFAILNNKNNSPSNHLELSHDFVLLLTGYEQDPNLFINANIELIGDNCTPYINSDTCESNIDGIYIIGTAVAGSQKNGAKHFIETSHIHINKVLKNMGVSNYPEYAQGIRLEADREY